MTEESRTVQVKAIELTGDEPIYKAISIIDRCTRARIALVVDHERRLIGTVTDGDVRRGLLRGNVLNDPVRLIMCSAFRSLPHSSTASEASVLMKTATLQQVPILDSKGQVVRLLLADEVVKTNVPKAKVLIMAGGEGRRLRPLTQDCPKPMLRLGQKPLLEIILEQCVSHGLTQFLISVNYLKEQIKDYFGDGARWNVRIDYLEETKPLGTCGALGLLPSKLNEPLLVINGDVLTRVDPIKLLRFHHEHDAAATLCVREYTTAVPYGVVELKDLDVLKLLEKPLLTHHINAGIYVLGPQILDLVPHACPLDMPQLFEKAIAKGYRVIAFPIHEYWIDIGHPEMLKQATLEWQ